MIWHHLNAEKFLKRRADEAFKDGTFYKDKQAEAQYTFYVYQTTIHQRTSPKLVKTQLQHQKLNIHV